MMKKLVILLACFGLAFQVTSCTSKSSQSDADVAADVDSADLERLEGDEALEIAADDSLLSDQLPEDALGETTPSYADTSPTTDVADLGDSLPSDPFAESSDTYAATDTPSSDTSYQESTPAPDSYVENSTSQYSSSSTTIVDNEAPAPRANIPLQKVAGEPWKVGKSWFNTVYFARPGDTLEGISERIYGSDRTSELRRGNPTYNSRDVRPGDKVYYSSPNRPEDSSRVLTYFEDNGMTPQVYVAQAGENIRDVSKNLLGYDGAWKEVWSSNTVDSKGVLSDAAELRYWKDVGTAVAAAPQQEPAQNQFEQHQEVAGSLPPPPPQEQFQDPYMNPPQDDYGQQAQGEIPPPPANDYAMDMPPPPPPPMDYAYDNVAPPPPPVEAINPPQPPQQVAEESGGMDNDSTMTLGIVGIAAAGLAALVVIRKKRKQRELEQQAMDNTHVGT